MSNLKGSLVVLAALLAAVALPAAAAEDAGTDACIGRGKLSKKVDKPIAAAQKAFEARNYQEVLAKVAEAEALQVPKTEWDNFWINEFKGLANTNLKQYEVAGPALETTVASPCMADADRPNRLRILMQVEYQLKDWAKAVSYGEQALKAGVDPEMAVFVGNAYYATSDYKNAQRVMDELISGQEARSKTPEETSIRILQSACVNLDDDACIGKQAERLVWYYPKLEYWQQLTGTMLRNSANDKQLLNILRVAYGADALTKADEYNELGRLAVDVGLPGEAQQVLEAGDKKGVFKTNEEKARNARLLDVAKKAAAIDKPSLDAQDARAKAKPTGDADVKLGAAYLSYDMPEKAVEALQRGIGKGGVKDPDEAAMLLGIAFLRTDNKEEAAKSFRNVSKDPMMSRIARLWLLKTA